MPAAQCHVRQKQTFFSLRFFRLDRMDFRVLLIKTDVAPAAPSGCPLLGSLCHSCEAAGCGGSLSAVVRALGGRSACERHVRLLAGRAAHAQEASRTCRDAEEEVVLVRRQNLPRPLLPRPPLRA